MSNPNGIRRFTDAGGVEWEVWEAHPRLTERRAARERRAAGRDGEDRRVSRFDARPPLAGDAGWLVFKSAREERRRTPIPTSWDVMTEPQLEEVLRRSRATGPYPRHPN